MKRRRPLLLALAWVLAACAAETVAPSATPTPLLLPLPQATATLPAGASTRPPTPVIIASPTPSATPVTHVVAEGETLLSVALDYGVSLEALQAANPGVHPRFLSIGTVLVIPPPEGQAALSATQLAPPPPAEVMLGPVDCHAAPTGRLYCFVEARNPAGWPLENVSARVTLAGADGLPFASSMAYAGLALIPAGGAAPLVAEFQPAPTVSIAAAAAEVITADVAADSAPEGRAVPLDIVTQTGQVTGHQLALAGQVRNPGPQALSDAWLTVTLYGEDGGIVGYRKVALPGGLGPGQVRDFAVAAAALAGSVDHYVLRGEGRP